MTRFVKASINISHLHPVVVMHALLVGLCLGIFLDSLYVNPHANMDALCTQRARYTISKRTHMLEKG